MMRLSLVSLSVFLLLGAFTIGSLLLVRNIQAGSSDSAKICRVAERNNTTLRNLLKLAQHNSQISLKNNPARLKASQQFYRQALALLKPVDCEKL